VDKCKDKGDPRRQEASILPEAEGKREATQREGGVKTYPDEKGTELDPKRRGRRARGKTGKRKMLNKELNPEKRGEKKHKERGMRARLTDRRGPPRNQEVANAQLLRDGKGHKQRKKRRQPGGWEKEEWILRRMGATSEDTPGEKKVSFLRHIGTWRGQIRGGDHKDEQTVKATLTYGETSASAKTGQKVNIKPRDVRGRSN